MRLCGYIKLVGCACLLMQCGCILDNIDSVHTELLTKAEKGDSAAIRELASQHWQNGDYKSACQWLKRAAAAGDAMAYELLGWSALTGDGVEQSQADAAFYFYLAGCCYWDRWLMAFGSKENEPLLTRYLCRQGSPMCDGWLNVEDRILTMANLNRAMLLGHGAAQRKKDVVAFQSGKLGMRDILPPYDGNDCGMVAEAFRDFVGDENFRAAFPGKNSETMTFVIAKVAQAAHTNAEFLVLAAKSIADMPSRSSELITLPRPESVLFVGLEEGFKLARERGRGWSYVKVRYTDKQEAQAIQAYELLEALSKREYIIGQMAKTLPLYFDMNGKERTEALFRSLVSIARMTNEEQAVLISCMGERDWDVE